MDNDSLITLWENREREPEMPPQKANDVSAGFGLALRQEAKTLIRRQTESLRDTGRISFGKGIFTAHVRDRWNISAAACSKTFAATRVTG